MKGKQKQRLHLCEILFIWAWVWEMNSFEAMVHPWFVQRLILVSHLSQLHYKLGDK